MTTRFIFRDHRSWSEFLSNGYSFQETSAKSPNRVGKSSARVRFPSNPIGANSQLLRFVYEKFHFSSFQMNSACESSWYLNRFERSEVEATTDTSQ